MEFITPINRSTIIPPKKEAKSYSITGWWDGFKEENLSVIATRHLLNSSDFVPEENYNPASDPQLNGYESLMHHFYFSQSQAESSAILNKLKKYNEVNKESPWYMLGRLTGAILDPSSYLFFTKFGQSAKIAGTAMLGEELTKQSIDPFRDDSLIPIVGAWGYTVPYLLNKLSNKVPFGVQKNLKELDDKWIGNQTVKDTDIAIDGTFVNPNKTDPTPSTVGAAKAPSGTIFNKGDKVIINSKGDTGTIVGFNKTNTKLGNLNDNYVIKLDEGSKVFATQKDTMVLSKEIIDEYNVIPTGSKKFTIKQQMEGEGFVKTNLGVFGEDGPWTPVFRLIKQKTSLTARKMIGDLLDTPLLKLKNTKEWGFKASGKSIETDMRMMRV